MDGKNVGLFDLLAWLNWQMNLGISFCNNVAIGTKSFYRHYKLRPTLDINTRQKTIEIETKMYKSVFGLAKW